MTSMPKVPTKAGLAFEFIAASALVATGALMVIAWLLLLVLAFGHVLDPWRNAGVILFGLAYVAIGAVPGVLGVMWARYLVWYAPMPWARWAKIPALVGTTVFSLGTVCAVLALIYAWAAS